MSALITIAILALIGLMARYANNEIEGYVESDLHEDLQAIYPTEIRP